MRLWGGRPTLHPLPKAATSHSFHRRTRLCHTTSLRKLPWFQHSTSPDISQPAIITKGELVNALSPPSSWSFLRRFYPPRFRRTTSGGDHRAFPLHVGHGVRHVPVAAVCQRRQARHSVESKTKKRQSSVGATYSDDAAPDGAKSKTTTANCKYSAPDGAAIADAIEKICA